MLTFLACIVTWLMGFASCWFYAELKLRDLSKKVNNLNQALQSAGNTIIEQSIEMHNILEKAAQCESGIIN